MNLIVMIPAYNEEQTIGRVIKEIPRKIDGIDKVKILVVDDGSTDKTVAIAKEAGADKIVRHPINRGVGVAFSTGLDEALKNGADIIVNLDADGQFNPGDIPKLIKPIIDKESDIVIGSRFLDKDMRPDMPFMKRIGNNIFTNLINKMAKTKLTDTQCGFRALSREVAMNIILFGKFTYTQEVLLDAAKKGFKVKEIPIKVYERENGKSKVVKSWYHYGLKAISIILRNYCDVRPLTIFASLALIIFIAGSIPFVHTLIYYMKFNMFTGVVGSALLSGFLFLTSLMILTFGILADMFKRQRQIQEKILYYEKLNFYNKRSK